MIKNLQLTFLSLIIGIVTAYSQVNLDSGLVAAYPFSGNANDTSGNGFNGTVNGAEPTTDRFNCPNSAYQFATNDDYINLQNILDTVFAGSGSQFSISVWFKAGQIGMTNNFLVTKVADGGCSEDERQFYFRILNDKIGFSYNVNSTSTASGRGIIGSTSINDTSSWYHIVVTYDGTINTNNGLDRVKIYVNSVADNTSFDSTPPAVSLGDIPNGTAPLSVGNYLSVEGSPCNSGTDHFYGKIDDILIYNSVISSAEVLALYNVPANACPVTAVTAVQSVSTISVYPNPANESVTVVPGQQGSYVYELITPEGTMISSGTLNGTIDVSGLQKGVYIIKLNGNNGSFAQKLIKN